MFDVERTAAVTVGRDTAHQPPNERRHMGARHDIERSARVRLTRADHHGTAARASIRSACASLSPCHATCCACAREQATCSVAAIEHSRGGRTTTGLHAAGPLSVSPQHNRPPER